MPVCPTDRTHALSEWWRKNELGRWYECAECGTTVLSPSARYWLLLATLRLRRLWRRRVRRLAARDIVHRYREYFVA